MRKSMSEIAELLDDVVGDRPSLKKSLSFDPASIHEMTPHSQYYNPYRTLPDGTFMPHPREYWTSQGGDPEGYQNVFEMYRDAGAYKKSLSELSANVENLIRKAENSDAPVRKITRDAFIYMEPDTKERQKYKKNFAQCGTCHMWTGSKGKSCTIHSPKVEITAGKSCALYTPGDPMPEMIGKEMGIVTPAESGLVEADVRCENCNYFSHSDKVCQVFKRLNASAEMFELDENVEPKACCNAWVGKTKELIQKNE